VDAHVRRARRSAKRGSRRAAATRLGGHSGHLWPPAPRSGSGRRLLAGATHARSSWLRTQDSGRLPIRWSTCRWRGTSSWYPRAFREGGVQQDQKRANLGLLIWSVAANDLHCLLHVESAKLVFSSAVRRPSKSPERADPPSAGTDRLVPSGYADLPGLFTLGALLPPKTRRSACLTACSLRARHAHGPARRSGLKARHAHGLTVVASRGKDYGHRKYAHEEPLPTDPQIPMLRR
jgi:hypothetical protein